MAEGTYENECNRAELLGINPPDRVQWEELENARKEKQQAEEFSALNSQDEKLTEGGGKLDDINNILSITQLRLNKFKKACGSLTNLLKIRGGADVDQSDGECVTDSSLPTEQGRQSTDPTDITDIGVPIENIKKSANDIQRNMSNQNDKLDLLLKKAEDAQYSMTQQNKQMTSYLKK